MNNDSSRSTRLLSLSVRRLRRAMSTVLMVVAPVIMLGTITGCPYTANVVRADPSLTSKDLVEGRIAIMPVKFDNDKATPNERSATGSLFIKAVRQNRADIPVVSNEAHLRALQGSLEDEAVFLRVYEENGLDPSKNADIKASLSARYFVLSRLHYEQRPLLGAAGNSAESTLSGTVSIVDTKNGAVVWEGEYSATRSGLDNMVDPHPSKQAMAFFSAFIHAWPSNP